MIARVNKNLNSFQYLKNFYGRKDNVIFTISIFSLHLCINYFGCKNLNIVTLVTLFIFRLTIGYGMQ